MFHGIIILYTQSPIIREFNEIEKALKWFDENIDDVYPVVMSGFYNGIIIDKFNKAYIDMQKALGN